ncbi:MAG: hypothetical protein ABMB14_00220 [Myxococcota bacterium]
MVAWLMACAADDAEIPTWNQDVQPIVARSCAGCHQEGALAARIPLDSYADAQGWASVMAAAVEARRMPPFSARETPGCTPEFPWTNDRRLSDDEIATIAAWADGDAPEGDPADPAPITVPPALSDVSATFHPGPFTVPARGALQDQYVCRIVDPALATDVYVEGMEVLPDRPEVVHHVLVFTDPAAASLAFVAPGSDTRLGDDAYACSGGTGVDGALLGGWVPGGSPLETPAGTAFQVGAGSLIVLQMHYHLAETAVDDATGVAFRATAAAPDRIAYAQLLGNAGSADEGLVLGPADGAAPEFRIPAGAVGHTETMDTVVEEPGSYQVFAVANHMHFAGAGMKVTVDGPDGERCLLETPDWDFDWQQLYTYDAESGRAPIVHQGDVVRNVCTYDNSFGNAALSEIYAQQDRAEPVDIRIGEGDLDEMCLAFVAVVPL